MNSNVVLFPTAPDYPTAPNVDPLAWALARMEPEAIALVLPGESWDELYARREAGRDILEELLAEYDGIESTGPDALAALLLLDHVYSYDLDLLDGAA